MKQLLFLTTIAAALLFSCKTVKKTAHEEQARTDSAGTKTAVVYDLKKKGTAGANTSVFTATKTTDSGYTKKKVTKEWFLSDEFDLGPDSVPASVVVVGKKPQDSTVKVAAPRGRWYYRETEEFETGNKKTDEQQAAQTEQKSKVNEVDSSGRNDQQQSNTSSNTSSTDKDKGTVSAFPGWVLIGLLAVVLLALWWYLKK